MGGGPPLARRGLGTPTGQICIARVPPHDVPAQRAPQRTGRAGGHTAPGLQTSAARGVCKPVAIAPAVVRRDDLVAKKIVTPRVGRLRAWRAPGCRSGRRAVPRPAGSAMAATGWRPGRAAGSGGGHRPSRPPPDRLEDCAVCGSRGSLGRRERYPRQAAGHPSGCASAHRRRSSPTDRMLRMTCSGDSSNKTSSARSPRAHAASIRGCVFLTGVILR